MTLKVTHSKCRCTACGDCFNSVAAPHPEEQQPAPNEQMVVAGWQFYQDGKWWNGDDRIKDHKKNTLAAGFRVRDVYADPQSATDTGSSNRSDNLIVDQTEQVAAMLASTMFSCELDEGELYRESTHPKAIACWNAACAAQDIITGTDVENAVAMLECEDDHEQPTNQPAPDTALLEAFDAGMRAARADDAEEIGRLREGLARCRHQASYSIGCEDALRIQLGKVRDIANEALAAHHKTEQEQER